MAWTEAGGSRCMPGELTFTHPTRGEAIVGRGAGAGRLARALAIASGNRRSRPVSQGHGQAGEQHRGERPPVQRILAATGSVSGSAGRPRGLCRFISRGWTPPRMAWTGDRRRAGLPRRIVHGDPPAADGGGRGGRSRGRIGCAGASRCGMGLRRLEPLHVMRRGLPGVRSFRPMSSASRRASWASTRSTVTRRMYQRAPARDPSESKKKSGRASGAASSNWNRASRSGSSDLRLTGSAT